ncbi:hypothetical protein BLOT_006486 [Blomia tropicalis]|nr:hypothetical protein BLOT_006486 [Blomia tropicalis]
MSMSLNSIHKLWTKLDDESDNKLQQQTIIYYDLVYVKDRPILCSQHVTGEGMKQCETRPDQTRPDQKRRARNDNGRTNEQIDLMANPMLCQD